VPRKSVCLLLNVLWGAFASPVGALELEIVSSFSTVGLTWSPASIAADLERDVLLLGGTDGSITEVSRDVTRSGCCTC
jgi:hypothetical protein